MSDIPFARVILRKALASEDVKFVHQAIKRALGLLTRDAPEFMTRAKLPPLTREQVKTIRRLREQEMPMNEIARKLGTNIGRVSEAINGKRNGI
jgi:DNA invertase Pin-like site-specific DNA recombinase